MKLVMFRADVLSCVSKDMVYQYKNIFLNSNHKPIYNIVKDDYSIQISKEPLEINEKKLFSREKTIITAGMLEPWKRQDDIIKAFNLIKNKIDANLIILGDGSQKEKFKKIN